MPAPIELSEMRFGRLVVLELASAYVSPSGNTQRRWRCICDCGSTAEVTTNKLTSGHTQSCGCFHVEQVRKPRSHGLRRNKERTKAYRAWTAMRSRCTDPNNAKFPIYGGRGIRICERWSDYTAFLADMGEPPSPDHSIDRIDGNGNYEPSNCRWASPAQQANNLRTTRFFECNGVRRTISGWAEALGVSRDTVKLRLKRGQSIEQVVQHFQGRE